MSSEYISMHEFGLCQERWYEKNAKKRNKKALYFKVIGFAITSFVTVVLLIDFPYSEVFASVLVWIGAIISLYMDESQVKVLGLSERLIAEKLRLLNAQYSASLISQEQYTKRLVDVLNSQVVKYEEISAEIEKQGKK